MKKTKTRIRIKTIALFSIVALFFWGCDGGSRYTEEGLDTVIKKYNTVPNFTIILYDQTYESRKYLHKYEVLLPQADSTLKSEITQFYPVSEGFFNTHINDLGMEVANKKDGVLSKTVAPAGYSQYVGNPNYGQWKSNGSGGSFWEFYGKFAFMNSMFNMMSSPARYGYYNDYRTNYANTGRTYRGPNNYYGTQSYMKSNTGKSSSWGQKSNSFRSDVRSRVRRSSSTSSSSRISRSSNRSSSGSSSRSRSSSRGGK